MSELKPLACGYMRVLPHPDDKTIRGVEQTTFAHRLVDVAEPVRRRAATSPLVVEGVVTHGRDIRQDLQSES